MKRLVCFCIYSLILLACSDVRKAGTASETTNGEILGRLSYSGPLAGLLVQLYDIDPAGSAPETEAPIRTSLSDSLGNFLFEDVPPGHYRLLVLLSGDSLGARSSLLYIQPDSTYEVPALSIHPTQSWTISFSEWPQALRPPLGSRIWIPGSGKSDSCCIIQGDSLIFTGIPGGSYDFVLLQYPSGAVRMLNYAPVIITDTSYYWSVPPSNNAETPCGFANVSRIPDMPWGGTGGDTIVVENFADLSSAVADTLARVVLVNGLIEGSDMIRVGSHKTISGVSSEAILSGFGLHLRRSQNVVLRNLLIRDAGSDAINIEDSTQWVWIHGNTLQNAGDGLLDIKSGSSYISVSWNHFHNQNLASLVGHSDNSAALDSGRLWVTFHHNWFEGTLTMNPRVRFGQVHLFNNLWTGNGDYGVASTQNAQVLLESNVFHQVQRPTVLGHTSPLPGSLVALDNLLWETGELTQGGTVFSPDDYYNCPVDSVEWVARLVRWNAGNF